MTAATGRTRSETKRRAILAAASELFLDRGPARTSMDSVAAAAGVSKQTVYSHFGDKEALFEACITEKTAAYRLADLPRSPRGSVGHDLTDLAVRYLGLLMDPGMVGMYRVVIGVSAEHPHIGALFHRNGPLRSARALSRLLQHHADEGHLALDDADEAACLFLDMLGGHLHRRMLLGVAGPLESKARKQHIERSVDRFLRLFASP